MGSWVATQRRYYKSAHLPMPEDRIKLLTDLGMEWSTKDPRKVPWMTRFRGLQAFAAKYGHTDVPHEFEEFPQLGFWVANQVRNFLCFSKGVHNYYSINTHSQYPHFPLCVFLISSFLFTASTIPLLATWTKECS